MRHGTQNIYRNMQVQLGRHSNIKPRSMTRLAHQDGCASRNRWLPDPHKIQPQEALIGLSPVGTGLLAVAGKMG